MRHLHGKLAVVSGASSGIGRAISWALAHQGARIAACDIDEAGLLRLQKDLAAQGCDIVAHKVDVADRDSAAAFAQCVHDAQGPADILVNSAGVFLWGSAVALSLEDWDWVLSVNLYGALHLCHAFLPPMIAAGQGGHVVNLSSMYGFWPSPGVAGYLTSKYAVFGYSQALREDLRRHHIGVSTVCPGIVNTGLVQAMRVRTDPEGKALERDAVARKYAKRGFTPEKVAHAVIKAIKKNRGLVLVSPEARLMYQVERFLPAISRIIARRAAAKLFGHRP